MKNIIIFIIVFSFIVFITNPNVFGESEIDKEREKEVKEASNSLKRENVQTEEGNFDEEIEKEDNTVKKKVGKLKKFLPTEKDFDEITLRTVWRYVDKQSSQNEEFEINKIQGLVRDVGRVYDPIVNKYKVATIQIEIIKYDNLVKLMDYWIQEKNSNLEKLWNNAYLIGTPNQNTECIFNYSDFGAMTICKTDEFVIQSVIFDKYQEHFDYGKSQTGIKKLTVNQNEITTRVVDHILKKIQKNSELKGSNELYKILESNAGIIERKENKDFSSEKELTINKNKKQMYGFENDKKYGIENFSCIKDEFGLITISGQYNNNQIKKDKIIMEIVFLDNNQNIILKNTANLLELEEYETKRFIGNLKIDKKFSICTIHIKN